MLRTNITEEMIAEQVRDSWEKNSFVPKDEDLQLDMDGNIHRIPVEGDRWGATSGAYYVHADGCPNWGFRDFRKHSEMLQFSFNWEAIPFENRRAYYQEQNNYYSDPQARQAEKTEALIRQRKKLQAEAEAKKAAILNAWLEYHYPCSRDFTPLHPYLQAKHVDNSHRIFFNGGHILRTKATEATGDICRKGELLIPLINAETFEFRSLVRIFSRPNPDGKFNPKPFYKGTHPTGCCCPLIPYQCMTHYDPTPEQLRLSQPYRTQERTGRLEADHVFICEGIATAFAVLELSECKYPVLAAMSCHNIINVAKAWRKLYPRLQITIAADNDNSGIEAADKTITAGFADKKIIPPIQGQDWNDYITSQKGF